MESYRTKDNHVAKYVHDDGSETAIKTIPVMEYGGVYGNVTNKYNIFISSSVGCPLKCKFCYLTTKKCPYATLEAQDIVANVMDAAAEEIETRPEIKDLYVKLSWMGMGDAYFDIAKAYVASTLIGKHFEDNEMSLGVDGVDIATTMPKIDDNAVNILCAMLEKLRMLKLNPARKYFTEESRSPIRLFYSLHSAVEETRQYIIPKTVPIKHALPHLKEAHEAGITVVLHHMFFEGLNDDKREVGALIKALEYIPNIELRLLRFNKCEGTVFSESPMFDEIVERIYGYHTNIKVQSSPGSEVKAACGQFLLSKIKDLR